MIELPEAIVVANQMKRILVDKKIIHIIKGQSPHKFAFFNKDLPNYEDILMNRVIEDVEAHGGHIEIVLGEYRLSLGEGVNIRYITHQSDLPNKHQLLLQFSDDTYVVVSIQMYGMIWLFKEGEFDNFYHNVTKEKPSPLSEEFSKEYFMNMLQETPVKLSAKAFLATEQRIPGLGNGVLQDILFNSKIHPKRKISTLSTVEKDCLFESIKSTLSNMRDLGGRNTEKDFFGNIGKYPTVLSNKTVKEPCPVCQGELIKKSYLGGSIYYCPVCQPEK
ncbi:MAG: endonuclease VIII [Coprobacillaceae bacterium]